MTWICPNCERVLRFANQYHSCVNQDLDSLFEGKSKELIYVFDKILMQVAEWEGVHISATKNCIVFVNTQTFFVIKPMQKVLNVKFYSEEPIQSPLIFKNTKYHNRDECHVRVSSIEEVSPLLIKWIRNSYELFMK